MRGASGALSGASGALSGVFRGSYSFSRDLRSIGNLYIIKASIVYSLKWIRHKIRYASEMRQMWNTPRINLKLY